MLAKLIDCSVKDNKRSSFSKAQEAWQQTSQAKGFLGQVGGWDKVSSHGIILACWLDSDSLDAFMSSLHDEIAATNKQQQTYERCDVAYLELEMRIASHPQVSPEGPSGPTREETKFIHLAFCDMGLDNRQTFLVKQRRIWNPGLSACKGMLGGYVWRSLDAAGRFVVMTCWESEHRYFDYKIDVFPGLKQAAGSDDTGCSMRGAQLVLDKSWRVVS